MKTEKSIQVLKQRLLNKNNDEKSTFCIFWETFKEFARNDKFECTYDDLLWEPFGKTIHIARQFIHEDNNKYEYMEQLNINSNVEWIQFNESIHMDSFWSEEDFDAFFALVEQTDVFKSINQNSSINFEMYFEEV